MKSILSAAGLHLLETFSNSNVLIVLDYDGTLSPIVRRQTQAQMRPRTRRLLARLSQFYPAVVLSGRSLRDLRTRTRGAGLRALVGNHGLEWERSRRSSQWEKKVVHCKRVLEDALASGAIDPRGIELEDKTLSLSVHYRLAPNRARTRRQIRAILKGCRGMSAMDGKFLVNVVPDVKQNKGTAVLALKKKFRCDRVVFVGDDQTDEHAFALRDKSFLLDVRVGRTKRSHARYFLADQKAMDRLLRTLIDFRR